MTPAALADRIAALDWSGVSLQHQLAVVAACETLRKALPAAQEALHDAAECCSERDRVDAEWVAAAPGNVLPFRAPSAELLRNSTYTPGKRITLTTLADGTPVASAILARAERWDWIVETTCSLLSCDAEQVAMVDDTVTVDGLPVFSC